MLIRNVFTRAVRLDTVGAYQVAGVARLTTEENAIH